MFDSLFNNREDKEKNKVNFIIEEARNAQTLYETIRHLKDFQEIAGKSKNKDNYDLSLIDRIITGKIAQKIWVIEPDSLKNELDKVFAQMPGYVPLEECLQEIGLTKEAIYSFFYQQTNEKIDDVYTYLIYQITAAEANGAYIEEYVGKANNALEIKKKLKEDFKIPELDANDLYTKKSFDYGKSLLEAYVKQSKISYNPDFFVNYLRIKDAVGNILSHLKVTEEFSQGVNETFSKLEEKAVMTGLLNIYKHLINADINLFSNQGINSYSNILENIKNFASENLKKSEGYPDLLITIDAEFEKGKKKAEEILCKEQDRMYDIVSKAAQSASEEYENLKNEFIRFSLAFSEILEEDNGTINKVITELEDTHRKAYYQKNRPNYRTSKEPVN